MTDYEDLADELLPPEEELETTAADIKEDKEQLKEEKEAEEAELNLDDLKGKKYEGVAIYAIRTTANREDQVMDFITSNVTKRGLQIYSVIRPHGMRSYIFIEAGSRADAEQAAYNIPYARGVLPKPVDYKEIEHMLEQVKTQMKIEKGDIVEVISGPFKREQAKITRIDSGKQEVVVELLQAAVPIPITVKIDSVKVIRREIPEKEEDDEDDI